MNEYENNNIGNENTNESINNSDGQSMMNAAPENTQPTFSSTYKPEGSGYTSYTAEGIKGGEGGYQPYGSQNFRGGYQTYTAAPQKKKSKAPIIILSVCGLVFVAFLFTFIGFSLAGSTQYIMDYRQPVEEHELVLGGNDTEKSDESVNTDTENTPSNSESITDTELPGATITKTPGGSVTTVEGKVGELMTKAQTAALVKDSVVEITTEQVVNGNSFYQYVQSGAGSGVIIAEEGYVITNNHVIDGANKITVRLTNGNEYDAKLIGTDASSDIAVIKISPNEDLTVAILGSSSKLSIAEEIIVIGNPLGELGGTVTNGIVSALAREITIDGENMTLIQTNAAVNPGNSGGGMFNLYGELVGVVNAKSSGEDVEGLGFAIPVDTAYDIVLQLMDYGYVRGRIDHGLNLIDINDLFTAASYRVSSLGVYVYESKYSDEIRNGDRIASINGKEVSTSAEVKEALSGCKVGDTVEVTLVRGGRFVNAKLTLHEYIPENAGEVTFE